LFDFYRLVFAHQTVVDVDRGQLITDGTLYQCRCNGGVNTSGESHQGTFVTDLLAYFGDLLFSDLFNGPIWRQISCDKQEIVNGWLTACGARATGVPQHTIPLLLRMFSSCDRHGSMRGGYNESLAELGDAVGVVGGDILSDRLTREQRGIVIDVVQGNDFFG